MAGHAPDENAIRLQSAVRHFNSGQMAEAESICRNILSRQPNNPGAWHLLGVIANTLGRSQEAAQHVRRAITIDPHRPNYHNSLGAILRHQQHWAQSIDACQRAIRLDPESFEPYVNLGNTFRDIGKLQEALAAFRQALQRNPNNATIYKNLGGALAQNNQLEDAIAALSQAVRLNPNYAEALSDLGNTFRHTGQLDDAETSCRRAIQIQPDFPEAFNNLGLALREKGRHDDAIAAFRQAIKLNPALPEPHRNLGFLFLVNRRFSDAIAAYREAARLNPDDAEFHNHLGAALMENNEIDESISQFQRAIQINPDYAEAHANLSAVLYQRGQMHDAAASAKRAIHLKPEYAQGHWNLALILLSQGNFTQGWREYEWRWQRENFTSPRRNFTQPQWDGRDLQGRTILLHAEQGLGDTLHFVRYAPMVAQRGGRVILECHRSLKRLLLPLPGITEIIIKHQPLPPFESHCPLLSLPLAFKTELASIPAAIPYLKPDAGLTALWKRRLESESTGRRVGLVWAGSPARKRDQNRSINLAQFAPLASVKNALFYSLQKGEAATQTPPFALAFRDFTSELNDFADTAALLENLDLVITVDTAVAHLAGAMGKPVWTLLPFSPDWRWMLNRDDSPWYPTMRLFRQPKRGDWITPINQIVERLFYL